MLKPKFYQYGKTLYRVWPEYAERLISGKWARISKLHQEVFNRKIGG